MDSKRSERSAARGHEDESEQLSNGLEQLGDERASLEAERDALLRATSELEFFRRAAMEALYIQKRDNPHAADAPAPASTANAPPPAREDGYRSQDAGLRVRVADEERELTKLKSEIAQLQELLLAMQNAKLRATRGPRTFLWASVATLAAAAVGAAVDVYFGSVRWSLAAPALVFPFSYVLLLSGILPAQAEADRSNQSRYPGG